MKYIAFVFLLLTTSACVPEDRIVVSNTIPIFTLPPQWTTTFSPSKTQTITKLIPSNTLPATQTLDIPFTSNTKGYSTKDAGVVPQCGPWISVDTAKYELTLSIDSAKTYKYIRTIFVITRYNEGGIRGIHLSCIDLQEEIPIAPNGTFKHEFAKRYYIEGKLTDSTHGHVKYNIPPGWCNYDGLPIDLSSIISDETDIYSPV
jgi:hypothetical protein